MNDTCQSLSHSRWDCKYHVVFVPKGRRKALFGSIRQTLGATFQELARQKECRIVEGHLLRDHVPMCIEIPPRCAVTGRHHCDHHLRRHLPGLRSQGPSAHRSDQRLGSDQHDA